MREQKTVGITVRRTDYKELDRMVTIVSPERGKLDVIVRGCRKQGSRLACAAEYFAYGEYVLSEKEGRFSLGQFSMLEAFYPLREEYEKLRAGILVLKLLEIAAQPGQSCRRLFSLSYHTLSFLCYGDTLPCDILLCYLLKYVSLFGFMPATTTCARCGRSTFSGARLSQSVGALCETCHQDMGETVQPLTLEAMRRMIELPDEKIGKVVLPEAVRGALTQFLPAFMCEHINLAKLVREDIIACLKQDG